MKIKSQTWWKRNKKYSNNVDWAWLIRDVNMGIFWCTLTYLSWSLLYNCINRTNNIIISVFFWIKKKFPNTFLTSSTPAFTHHHNVSEIKLTINFILAWYWFPRGFFFTLVAGRYIMYFEKACGIMKERNIWFHERNLFCILK